jgi:uncharacterized membrane protein YfbV (UPF0208 family)
MATATANDVVGNLQSAALNVLNDLVAHKIKGADLILNGLTQLSALQQEASTWYEELKALLQALQPFFGMVREWLSSAYTHLVQVYDWAKAMWHKIFG